MTNLSINNKPYSGPSSWDELVSQKQFLRLFKLSRIAVGVGYAKFLALKVVYGIPRRVAKLFFANKERMPDPNDMFSPSDRAALLGIELLGTLQWVWDKVPMLRWYYPTFRIFGRKFKGIDDGFRGLTFGQYMFAERFFEAAQKENSDYKMSLRLFLGTLYRPAGVAKFDNAKIEKYAKWMRWLPAQKQEAIVFNYAGLRYQLTKEFPEVFPKPDEKGTEKATSANAAGWLDVALSLSGKDLNMLYTYENADLWLVMKVLTNVIKENKAIEALSKKK